jgi:hypothetical protein
MINYELVNEAITKSFGFILKNDKPKGSLESIDISHEDGSVEVATSMGGIVGFSSNFFAVPTNEIELIKTYRTLALTADFDRILNEIRNEIFIFDVPNKKAIEISFDKTKEKKIKQIYFE